MLKQKHSISIDELGITIETGTLAKQANGSVTVKLGDTIVFVAATAANSTRPDQDWFPLMVDYREKFSAAGKFPGGFFKREGRPSEKEVLTSRLCDRPLRPLFPKGFINEVQVIGMLFTADLINEPDVLMVNAASAALMVSNIPFKGPIGCVRVGQIKGEFVVNPTYAQQEESDLDLIYVGNKNDMMMIEGSAKFISDERFIEALEFAHKAIQPLIDAQIKLAEEVGVEKKDFELHNCDPEILEFIRKLVGDRLQTAVFQDNKANRDEAVTLLKDEAAEKVEEKVGEEEYDSSQIRLAFEVLQEEVYRQNILDSAKRADGRKPEDLREITCQAGVLPGVHGSALFQRGETQAIVISTLGTTTNSQNMDGLSGGETSKTFMLHYNFPNFSVGETGRMMGPGRREIGHGALAERSLRPVVPDENDFPYAIRIVSEIMESNGSTSMASICGGCLSLMDAGVPISEPVAGISVGLVSESDADGKITKNVILTDILGAEDHFGDMDFKIAGTKTGITGFQLDLKIKGLPMDIAKESIIRNKEARLKILEIMTSEMDKPNDQLKPSAPQIKMLQINPEKIGALIGPGGKNIRKIIEITGAEIDINEDNSGRVNVYANNDDVMKRAIHEIDILTAEIEVGKTYRGIVKGTKEFGAFVECIPGQEGLVHISELSDTRVRDVEDVCRVGDEIWVKCVSVDDRGRVKLSRKVAMAERAEKDA